MDIQLKKGLLEVCVLAVVEWQDSYGYQIMKDLSACVEISESTLYPISVSYTHLTLPTN